jgi:hypothetical protein
MHSLRLCSIAALVAIGSTAWAGQPLNTEDAGVLGRSDCEFETSLRRQTERAADTANAMALKVGCGVGWRSQVALGLDAERSGGRTDRSMRLGGKTALNDAGSGQPAFALAWELASVRSAGGSHALEDTTAQAVTSLMLRPALQLHANLGWTRSRSSGRSSTLWALALERSASERLDLMAEVYASDRDRSPWIAAGLRWSVVPDKLSIDASAGLQTSGARPRRMTLGLNAGF